ncbi:MAG: multifunctional CCA tRNA nucleotidyl transferase/2'3'-cyclic phosphodiesterase/2'nucleotidase/phosphatase [Burkholderiaceae bacterium]
MQIYLVGGAVRDALLGLPVQDRDWLVVGATPQQMLAQGYLAVGKDFPVFLHPQTREEYALARTERKTAPGYQGFAFHAAPEVTLEQDLARRDLTINSIAIPADFVLASGHFDIKNALLIDPFGGQADLHAKVLRHTASAFREDPVRLLRLARFAARFGDFSIAPETQNLLREMTASGEVDALVPERVWQELARGVMEAAPARMLTVLDAAGALARLAPEMASAGAPERFAHSLRALGAAAAQHAALEVRWASWLVAGLGAGAAGLASADALAQRWRVPADCRDLAQWLMREHRAVQASPALDAAGVVQLLDRADAWRRPERLRAGLCASEIVAATALADVPAPAPAEAPLRPRLAPLLLAWAAARGVVTADVAGLAQRDGLAGPAVAGRIQQARVQAVAGVWPTGAMPSNPTESRG